MKSVNMFMKISALILFSAFSSPTLAALSLELTQGIDAAIPMATVPFHVSTASNHYADKAFAKQLNDIIHRDLLNSGHFRFLSSSKFPQSPSHMNQVKYASWQQKDIDDLLIGQIQTKGGGLYQVNYQLLDVFSAAQNPAKGLLLNKSFNVRSRDVRRLAHRISDQIFEQLIGKKGIFSTHIAYVVVKNLHSKNRRYQLVVADADGYNPQVLLTSSEPIMSPEWSPDGRKLAYVSFEKHRAAIYIQEVATGTRRLISAFRGINGAPSWSPDGKEMALVLDKTGRPKIYTMNLATKKLRKLTSGWSIDTEPAWSPDGRYLVFTSNRSGGPQIYKVSRHGGGAKRVTYDGRYNASATFTPDGKELVMLHGDKGRFMIAKQSLNDSRLLTLTHSDRDQSPSIAPNGEMVLYATNAGGKQVLGMVSVDATIRLRLPAQEGDVREPAWSIR